MNEENSARNVDFASGLANAVRENPLPAALIGMGLAWLFTGGRTSAKTVFGAVVGGAAGAGSRLGASVRTSGQSIGETLASMADHVGDGAAATGAGASASVSSLRDSARALPSIDGQFLATARANVSDLLERQPLLLGAIGLAIGAGVAASLPTSETETQVFGDASANLLGKTRDFAVAQTQRVREAADGVVTTVAEEARIQGLTPTALKDTAGEVGRGVKGVLEEAGASVRKHLN